MAYREKYITLDQYLGQYQGKNLYIGFVIGYGYCSTSGFAIQPPHMNGYSPSCGRLYGDDSHYITGRQQVEDRSPEAVKLSLRGLFVNGEAVITVKSGMMLSHIATLFDVTVGELVKWNKIENPDKIYVGQKIKIHSDLNNSSIISQDKNEKWRDTAEILAGIAGLVFSSNEAIGRVNYSSNLAMQFRSNFEFMNLNKTKVMVDNSGKIWQGADKSSLVNKALTDKIPNTSRYFPKVAPYLKFGGYACGIEGIGLSGYRFLSAYQNKDTLDMVDAGADVVMGGVGFIPVYGWMVSGGYFILKPLVKRHTEIVIKSQIEMGIVGLSSTMPFK